MHSNEELNELKRLVPLWAVAQTRLKGMTKRGVEFDFLCPYHQDTSQSFQVYQTDDGMWLGKCQACGVSKNVFQLIQDADKVSFSEALKMVKDMSTSPDWAAKRKAADAVFQQTLAKSKEVTTVPLENFASYVENLQQSDIAKQWLKSRGISLETAEIFSLGFVQQPMADVVPTNHPWSAAGWILFPEIRNSRVVAIKYRSVMGKRIPKTDTTPGWSGFAQRKGMTKSPLFNLEAVNPLEDLFVVEGEPDALIMAQAGFCVVSLPSAGFNPPPDMRDVLMRAPVRYLAGDTDEVGVEAMVKLCKELGGDNPKSRTFMLQWPKPYKDANQYFLEGCGGNISKFHDEVVRLTEEARSRRLPGVQDLKVIARNAKIKPTRTDPRRLEWPWPNINEWVDILPGEVMFMFATETKMGKSTWLMNVLVHNILVGKKVINFSAELSPERYVAMVAAHMLKGNRNNLTDADFIKVADRIPEDHFYFGYKPGAKFKEVMKLLADAKQVYGGDIFVVDPLHFILRGGTPGQENSEFAAAMRELVDFAIKWNVIVIVVGQPRKSLSGSRGRVAQGQDARGTAALTEDAATTWILHRNRVAALKRSDEDEEEPVFEATTKVKLDYSRNSEPRSTKLVFEGATATFAPWSSQTVISDPNEETAKR